jgi:hypothetical protein
LILCFKFVNFQFQEAETMKMWKMMVAVVLVGIMAMMVGCGGGGGNTTVNTGGTSNSGTGNSTTTYKLTNSAMSSGTCTSSVPTGTIFSLTQAGTNTYSLSGTGVYFGRRGDTTPFTLTLNGNTYSGTSNVAATATDPTAWNQTLNLTADTSGNLTGSIVKTGSGGECSATWNLAFTKQ